MQVSQFASVWLIGLVCLALMSWSPQVAGQAGGGADEPNAASTQRVRMVLGGEYWMGAVADDAEAYLDYLAQVRPDVIHLGVLGPELASSFGTPDHQKAITEVAPRTDTLAAYHQWWSNHLARLQELGIRVQTTISMTNAWGNHESPHGWFRYYNERWDSDLLGPRPVDDVMQLMERDLDGNPIYSGDGDYRRYGGCVNNPHWREVLKQFVEAGIDAGFDGFMVQYPHARTGCACEYCQAAFRDFLERRHDPEVLEQRLGVAQLDDYEFATTGPRPGMPAWIDLEARQFAAESVRACFEDVFIEYGRSLKPDLVVSLWTHHRQFLEPDVQFQKQMTNTDIAAMVDERLLLPMEQWGRGEDYLWYSTPVYFSDLEEGLLGDASLTSRYLHAMGDGRPFVTVKYDYFRWRLMTAEAMTFGGAAFGAWRGGWSGGEDREDPHLGSYFQFIRDHSDRLWPREFGGEVAGIYPRGSLFNGNAAYLEPMRQWGKALHRGHVLFDILIDQRLTAEQLQRYAAVVVIAPEYLNERERRWLDAVIERGGVVIDGSGVTSANTQEPNERDAVMQRNERQWHVYTGDITDSQAMAGALRDAVDVSLSQFDAPWTVQVHAHRQPERDRLLLHLVNYNRDESQGRSELPIAADPIAVDLRLPDGASVSSVRLATPERSQEQAVTFEQDGGRLTFEAPSFLVYAMLTVEFE